MIIKLSKSSKNIIIHISIIYNLSKYPLKSSEEDWKVQIKLFQLKISRIFLSSSIFISVNPS